MFTRLTRAPRLLSHKSFRIVDLRERRDLTWRTVSNQCILERLGGGGTGVISKTGDTHFGRFVALKFILEDLARDRQALLPSILSGPTVGRLPCQIDHTRLLSVCSP